MQLMTLLEPFFSMMASLFQGLLALTMAATAIIPSTETPITAVNPDEVQLTFVATGDSQVNAFNKNIQYFDATIMDVCNAETQQDAFLIAGDITENCLTQEWDAITDVLIENGFEDRLILASGNHDIRLRDYSQSTERFTECYNMFNEEPIDSMRYTTEVNGYKFIVMSSDEEEMEEAYISEEQLEWLDAEIADVDAGMPVFVILHQPLRETHGLPMVWGSGSQPDAGHVGAQSDAILNVLLKHENVILINGHTHTGFGEYTYELLGEGVHSVNVPAIGKKNSDGEYLAFATGYTVEVYEDEVLFRARDFGKGCYLPDYDISIELI